MYPAALPLVNCTIRIYYNFAIKVINDLLVCKKKGKKTDIYAINLKRHYKVVYLYYIYFRCSVTI